jgi:hypothetical protein
VTQSSGSKKRVRKALWFERVMAVLALANLGLVVFDLSYIPFRDYYLRYVPAFTDWYGSTYKGIQPHRDTEAYLALVDQLENQVASDGLSSPKSQELLTELRSMSDTMIDEDPFQTADKSGTLQRIKNRMRDFVGTDSSKAAFNTFWSQGYLSQDWPGAIAFFSDDIKPLIATNYYRGIGEDGRPVDEFWRIDLWFVGVFGVEFLLRTLVISRRYRGTTWIDAMLWRMYDVLLLIPFWRWLRVIPVSIRLTQSKLVDVTALINRTRRALVTNFAVELTEIVVLRMIDQVQNLLREGEIGRMLVQPPTRRYVDLNGIDEIDVIAKRLISVLVYQVLPKIKPDLDSFLSQSLLNALHKTPVYQGIQRLPGFEGMSEQLTQRLMTEISQSTYGVLTSAIEDESGAALMRQLVQVFIETLQTELRENRTLDEIQSLLTVLLDEVKINYVKRIAEEDLEALQEKTQQEIYDLIEGR